MAKTVREIILSALLAAVLFFGINSVTSRSYIEGPSMEPSLHRGQVLLISRLGISGLSAQVNAAAHLEQAPDTAGWIPPRGSIVTLLEPNDPQKVLIKRVVGLPGETIAMTDGAVYINGQPLNEPYVVFRDRYSMPSRQVPEGSVYVLGDNRPNSSDSRFFGPVPQSDLLGLAVLRYWPLSELGWMLGGL